MKTALKRYLFFTRSSLEVRSILDFIIYFRAPTVSLLSESCDGSGLKASCDGSGLKAITDLRRRKRKALRCKSIASERKKISQTSGGSCGKVACCLGGRLWPPFIKGCKHFSTKTTHGHQAGRALLLCVGTS